MEERTGLVVIRVWAERPREDALRARITVVPQLASAQSKIEVASDTGEVVEIVRRFLEDFSRAA